MTSVRSAPAAVARPKRHTVAKWASPRSLRGRLLLFVALISAVVVGALSYFEVRSFALSLEAELADTAQRTAQATADDLENRPAPLDPLDVRDILHDFAETDAGFVDCAPHVVSLLPHPPPLLTPPC